MYTFFLNNENPGEKKLSVRERVRLREGGGYRDRNPRLVIMTGKGGGGYILPPFPPFINPYENRYQINHIYIKGILVIF